MNRTSLGHVDDICRFWWDEIGTNADSWMITEVGVCGVEETGFESPSKSVGPS